jgi:iron complex outermembrane recepter protein
MKKCNQEKQPRSNLHLNAVSALLISGLALSVLPTTLYAKDKLEEKAEEKQKSKTKAADNSVFDLGTVTVTANNKFSALESKDILTSVDVMYADKIEDQNVQNSYELFHRMPGVQITQFNQGTTNGKLSFRGFNGEGNINAVKLLIDGIPSNSNDGSMPFIDSLFPLDIDSIEVVRGTNDPRYGLHAIAGSANILTQTGGNYAKVRSSYGSFDSHDVQAGAGYEKNGFSQNYSVGYRSSDGYRDHSNSDKKTFSGKWFYTPESEKFRIGLSARWNESVAQEAGYLTFADSRARPTMTNPYNATDGDHRQIGQVSGHFDVALSKDLFWSTKSYVNTLDDQRFVKFSAGASQQERQVEEVQYGGITSMTYRPKIAWLDDFSLEGGFDIQQQDNKSPRYTTIERLRTKQTRVRCLISKSWAAICKLKSNPTNGYALPQVSGPTKWRAISPTVLPERLPPSMITALFGNQKLVPWSRLSKVIAYTVTGGGHSKLPLGRHRIWLRHASTA